MNRNINLLAFGTFGNPNGFRQTFFIGRKELEQVVKTFDLNTNAIKLVPNSKLYLIRKENLNGLKSISYAVYTFAKEHNSERGGTFIGSSLLYTNEIANESLTVNILNDFHKNLVSKNVLNDIIKVNHSDNFSVTEPNDFDKIPLNLNSIEEVNFNQFSNKILVVYSQIKFDVIVVLLQKSLELLNEYDAIYFTDNNEIAEFVHHKALFKLVKIEGFEQEIISIQNERKNRAINSISEFELEKQKLESDKVSLLSEWNNQVSTNEKLHSENQIIIKDSINNIEKIKFFYTEFARKLDDYINQLKSGRKIEPVRELYNENKKIFITSISELRQPNYIKNIPKVKAYSKLQTERESSSRLSEIDNLFDHNSNYKEKHRNINYYKILTFLLAFLLISMITYIIWISSESDIYKNKYEIVLDIPEVKEEEAIEQTQPTKVVELKPMPDTILSDNDLKLVLKERIKGKSVGEIVDIIFRKNPADIGKSYKNQKGAYELLLISKNKNSFRDNNCVSDSLKIIPSLLKK